MNDTFIKRHRRKYRGRNYRNVGVHHAKAQTAEGEEREVILYYAARDG